MKRFLFTSALLMAISSVCMAQSSDSFKNGDNLFSVGIGLGSPYFGAGYASSLPINPTVNFEHGITDAIGVGAVLSYASSKYNYGSGYYYKESATYVGARGAYHINQFLSLGSQIDLYGGVSIGYIIASYSNNIGGNSTYTSPASPANVGYGAFVGGKYYFQSNIGVYGEVGYESLSFLNVGVTFKF